MNDEGAQRLIWAIVEMACRDYMNYKRATKRMRNFNRTRIFDSTVKFFQSDWWDCLMPNIDGRKVMQKLDEIVSKGEKQDVCKQQLCESLEDLSKERKGSEVYFGSTFNE